MRQGVCIAKCRRPLPAILLAEVLCQGGIYRARQPYGLRHVRMRGSDGGETPECYGIADDETGQPKGLWRFLRSRVYASTSGKPSTHTGALKGVSKIVPVEYKGKHTAPNPKAQVWTRSSSNYWSPVSKTATHPSTGPA